MCQKCNDALDKYYPNLNEEERGDLLMSATAFPFGDAAYIENQLKELVENTDGTLHGALAFVDQEMHQILAESHAQGDK